MQKTEFSQIISQIETQSNTVRYDFEIADIIRKVLEEKECDLTPKQKEQLGWEFLLFRLMTKNRFNNNGLKTERFTPMATFTNGSIFPDPDSFSPKSLEYFEKRAKESRNSILKARYFDFLWEKLKAKRKHLFAIKAIEQYLLCVNAYKNDDTIIEKLDCLQRATELSITLEGKKDEHPLTTNVVTKLTEQINRTIATENYRWLIEMFELVLALDNFFSKHQVEKYIAVCGVVISRYHSDKNFHLQRSFLNLRANLTKLLDPSAMKHRLVQDEIGQSFVDEAKAKSGSGLVSVHFLQEAVKQYSKLGNTQKVNSLIDEIKHATRQAINNREFKTISSTIKIDPKDFEYMKMSLGTREEVPEKMGTLPTFFPDWNHAVRLTEKLKKRHVLQYLVRTVHYSDRYPVSRPQTEKDIQEDHVMGNFKLEAELALNWLTGFLTELIKENKVTLQDFEKFLAKIKAIDEDTHETVLEGLKSYFKGDHFHATYVLTLQLEDFLRHLLTIFGGQTTRPEAGTFREKPLRSILTELKPYLSEPIYRYISWVMVDYRGFNLRNNVAHGFLKKRQSGPVYSTATLHIFCLLIANTKVSVNKKRVSRTSPETN
ncbi:MAG: DUF4209 domain-containing protein [bacterium]